MAIIDQDPNVVAQVDKLVRHDPSEEQQLRSLASQQPVTIRFVNQTDSDCNLVWLDFTGSRKDYGQLAAGAIVSLPTFATHPWIVTDAQGKALGIYIAGEKRALVEIR